MRFRFLLFSVLAVCLLHVAGYFPVFKLQQKLIQYKIEVFIKQAIQNKDIHIISISTDNQHELYWQRKDKEFWYKGQLYDIVRIEQQADVILYHCFNDTAETHLAYQFLKNIKKQTEHSDSEHTSLTDLFKKILKVYYPSSHGDESLIRLTHLYVQKQEPIPYLKHYHSRFYNAIDPPPKSLI